MSAHTLIAVPIVTADPPLDVQVREARAAGADLVELRVDRIGNVPAVLAWLSQPRILPAIVTVRSATEGGAWTGDESGRVALLAQLAELGPEFIDIEHATWQRSAALRQTIGERGQETGPAARTRLILSCHSAPAGWDDSTPLPDAGATPPDLGSVLDALATTPADVLKLVIHARDATDACRVLEQLARRATQRSLIALAMGEAGLATRILARKFGALLTFASLRAESRSAPGQPTVAELRGLYRWDHLGPRTRVYGVVGWPVTHSLSPAVHNAAFSATETDAVHVPFPVQPGQSGFAAFMERAAGSRELAIAGLSVTLPHKENALHWLDTQGFSVSPPARRCGAVNTLVQQADGTWTGENTDGAAAVTALETVAGGRAGGLRGACADILGAGGAARAIIAALSAQGCRVTLYNRSDERARRVAQELRCRWLPWEARARYAGDILVNCTPVGMWPLVEGSPMPDEALRERTVVLDTVYRPAQTRLLRAAEQRGCATVSGRAMFLAQAAAQFELWHNRTAPIRAMEAALVGADV